MTPQEQPDSRAGDEQLDHALIELYEFAMVHGEAQANGVGVKLKQRENTIVIAKAQIRDYAERLATERAIETLEKLKQWNGAYIGIGGKRVDHMVHHDVINAEIAALSATLTKGEQ